MPVNDDPDRGWARKARQASLKAVCKRLVEASRRDLAVRLEVHKIAREQGFDWTGEKWLNEVPTPR